MKKKEIDLMIGSLLHDIGKVIYRTGSHDNHSSSGYSYLKEEIGIDDVDVLESVLYHHASMLRSANISKKSLAYITYIADNIASAADRRDNSTGDYGFEMSSPLEPVFNILNGNNQRKYYHPSMLDSKINFPTEDKVDFDEGFYTSVKLKITETLKSIELNDRYINSLLEIFEATMSYLPSSTAKGEKADISLYDHSKMTMAIASCIYFYLTEKEIDDFKKVLLDGEADFKKENCFVLFSIDVSGIQKFIYTIHSEDALKMLRSRSFYLEIMMEHIVDDILEHLGLSRANLIYSGGGHCYMLLPNTRLVKDYLDEYEKYLNEWLLKQFDISLYIAMGYVEANPDNLKNVPEGSYLQMYRDVSSQISNKKLHRYNAGQIRKLNDNKKDDYSRECRICRNVGKLTEDGVCPMCSALKNLSANILSADYFTITNKSGEKGVPLPGDNYIIAERKEDLLNRIKKFPDSYVRIYAKNSFHTGIKVASKIWVGNYSAQPTFEQLIKKAKGIERLGVLRADVDNLGQAIVAGFDKKYTTLSRTATLSRQLSLFFKYYINDILENGESNELLSDSKKRNATVVYSGGDDLFIVGAWNDIIELAIDINNTFQKYTEGTLKISGGIGLYAAGYPISRMADEVGSMENMSKRYPGKEAITLFLDGKRHKEKGEDVYDGTYRWDVFINDVIKDKYKVIYDFFGTDKVKGKNFLYNLLELIRNQDDRINFARFVYLLSRMEPQRNSVNYERYKIFARKMYQWIQNESDSIQLKTAINIYAYITRSSKEDS